MSSAKRHLVVAIGELLWDILPTGEVLGGAPANFCYRLSTLAVDCHLVSRIGRDQRGETAVRILCEKKVSSDLIQVDDSLPTGYVTVSLDVTGNASYIIHSPVAYDSIEFNQSLANAASKARVICFGTLIQRAEKSRDTVSQILDAGASATKIVDIHLRTACYSRETIEFSLRAADIAKLNDSEIMVLKDLLSLSGTDERELTEQLVSRYDLNVCLLTRGAKGVIAVSRAGDYLNIPAPTVTVVDTIGAGDAFTAGFIAAFLRNKDLATCCEMGNLLDAAVAESPGGMSPVPLIGRLSELL